VYLNLILEFIPETLYQYERQHTKANKPIPITNIKACLLTLHSALVDPCSFPSHHPVVSVRLSVCFVAL
jgi:hypothetical protein